MASFHNLSISTKFNIILASVMLCLFLVASLYNYHVQQALIVKGAVDNARIIANEIIQAREYMSSVVTDEPSRNYNLVPQVVATKIAKKLTENSNYYVRQVSLRYRNPENRPDEYEAQQLVKLKSGKLPETYNIVTTTRGKELRFMLAMKAEKSCLGCHGPFESAPRFVQQRFPKGHYSYNYSLDEVIGAVSVTVPMAGLYHDIAFNLRIDLLYRTIIFFIVILLMGALIRWIIINPIRMLSHSISHVTKTGMFGDRLPQPSEDEIGKLISAFNDMMEELERKTLQSRESEDRYRNFIKMAQSAVVTFMEDGKIVISNEKAEKLLGIHRNELLGENFFSFFSNSSEVQEGITRYLREGVGGGVGESTRQTIVTAGGKTVQVEMALSVSKADKNQIFTAILRETPGH